MKKVLVTTQIPREGLISLYENFEVDYPQKTNFTYEEVIAKISDYNAIIAPNMRIDKRMIDAASNLEIVSNYGAGYDNVDTVYAAEKGIVVANTPNSVTEATAELAYGIMTSVVRRIALWDRRIRCSKDVQWGRMDNLEHTLYGKSLGIIGMGRIGRAVAKRAFAGGMRIYYHNRNRLAPEWENILNAVFLPFEELLKISDIISINTPLTPDTHHLIGAGEFEAMKHGVYIVNTARGAVIDEKALVKYLKTGKVAGAGLDVFENEPLISSELLGMDQVVMTPHIGTDTYETNIEMAREAALNIEEYYRGRTPANIVNSL